MGMTIENAITWLNTDDFESKGFADATSVAIDTMRKYQKIEEIVTEWQNENDPKIKFARSNMEKVKEVLEDGND